MFGQQRSRTLAVERTAGSVPYRADSVGGVAPSVAPDPLETRKPCDLQGFHEYRHGDSNSAIPVAAVYGRLRFPC